MYWCVPFCSHTYSFTDKVGIDPPAELLGVLFHGLRVRSRLCRCTGPLTGLLLTLHFGNSSTFSSGCSLSFCKMPLSYLCCTLNAGSSSMHHLTLTPSVPSLLTPSLKLSWHKRKLNSHSRTYQRMWLQASKGPLLTSCLSRSVSTKQTKSIGRSCLHSFTTLQSCPPAAVNCHIINQILVSR